MPGALENAAASKWPAVLRWCDWVNLNALEALVIRSPLLQRWVLASHEQAICMLTASLPGPKRIVVIGGALFPRVRVSQPFVTPEPAAARLQMFRVRVDNSYLSRRPKAVHDQGRVTTDALPEAELTFIPLAFDQDKTPLYRGAERGTLVVHDWPRRGEAVLPSLPADFRA